MFDPGSFTLGVIFGVLLCILLVAIALHYGKGPND
jgi:hypothetical protein